MYEIIKKYSQISGISGQESLVKNEFLSLFKNQKTKIYMDNLGGVATKIPSIHEEKALNIGVFAHMDEVGLMVDAIMDDGRASIKTIGGINVEVVVSSRVFFIDKEGKKHIGIISSISPHLNKKAQKLEDLKVDFGYLNKENAEKYLEIGMYLNLIGEIHKLAQNNIVSKALDNRVGCAIIEKLFNHYKNMDTLKFNLFLGATVQEEVGLRGGPILLNTIENSTKKHFDKIIVVDVSPIDEMNNFGLQKGPLLRISEPRMIYSVEGNRKIREIAEKNKIKIQEYISKGRTDGNEMQKSGIGNNVNAICIPAYNLHSPNTIINLDDVEDSIELIIKYLSTL